MPAFVGHNASIGVPRTLGPHSFAAFNEVIPIFEELNLALTGITRDSAGVALASCTVLLFQTADNVFVSSTVSDGAGGFSFTVSRAQGPFFLVAYKGGTPVRGTSDNTLYGA